MNTRIVISHVVFAFLLLSPLSFAAGEVPSGLPPKDKQEAAEDDPAKDEAMVEEPASERVTVTFTIPDSSRELLGFAEFIEHVAEGRVDDIREVLAADVELARQYLSEIVALYYQDGLFWPGGTALDIAAFGGDDAMFAVLLGAMGNAIVIDNHPIHTAIWHDRADYLARVLAMAVRHPEMRWALLGNPNRGETIPGDVADDDRLVGMNGLDLAVRYGKGEHVALILKCIEAHPELADWLIPDRRHLPNLETPLKVAAVAFNRLMVELLLGSPFADRFYVNPDLIVNAWMNLPRSREREAQRLLMAQIIIYFKPEFAAVHAHEYFVENAFLNCDAEELRQQVRNGHHASPATIRNILEKLKEFYGADFDLLGRLIVLYSDFMNQLIDLQREVQTARFWAETVNPRRVRAGQDTVGSLIGDLQDWLTEIDRGRLPQLVGPVLAAIVFRELGLPWKQRR